MLTIELARVCGWKPTGTHRDTVLDGSGGDALHDVRHLMGWQTEYMSNDGQTVSSADAIQLADALMRAITEADQILLAWSEGNASPPTDVRTNAGGFRWFSTSEGKIHLQNIADFCRGGAFQIF